MNTETIPLETARIALDAERSRWTLPKQTILTNRADPTAPPGDCWRCCVAAILKRPAGAVPHFVAQDGGLHYERETQKWLLAQGYVLVHSPRQRFDVAFWEDWDAIPPTIVCGPTPRSQRQGQHHAVVYQGHLMVYDPHPDDTGLTAITSEWLIARCL